MQHHHNCSTKCENKDSNKTGKDQLQFTEIYSNKSQSDQLSSSSSSDVNSGRSQLETILLSGKSKLLHILKHIFILHHKP